MAVEFFNIRVAVAGFIFCNLLRRAHNTRAIVPMEMARPFDCEPGKLKVQIITGRVCIRDNIILAFKLPGNVIEFIDAFLGPKVPGFVQAQVLYSLFQRPETV